mmetsp:Transcript_26399/g.51741  ORF Transcript_26399/g.51741 Transcript_26399/m.51741 type:complete len:95 (+) Transcript_26399:215-499(+)
MPPSHAAKTVANDDLRIVEAEVGLLSFQKWARNIIRPGTSIRLEVAHNHGEASCDLLDVPYVKGLIWAVLIGARSHDAANNEAGVWEHVAEHLH